MNEITFDVQGKTRDEIEARAEEILNQFFDGAPHAGVALGYDIRQDQLTRDGLGTVVSLGWEARVTARWGTG